MRSCSVVSSDPRTSDQLAPLDPVRLLRCRGADSPHNARVWIAAESSKSDAMVDKELAPCGSPCRTSSYAVADDFCGAAVREKRDCSAQTLTASCQKTHTPRTHKYIHNHTPAHQNVTQTQGDPHALPLYTAKKQCFNTLVALTRGHV